MVLSCLLHFSEPGPMKVGFKIYFRVFPGGSAAEESACNVGALGLIPGLGRSPEEEKGYPLQYGESHGLYSPWGCKESDATEQL